MMLTGPIQFGITHQGATGSSLCAAFSQIVGLRQDTKDIVHWADYDDIRNTKNGDPDAYRRLIERHQAHVGKLLWRFTRDRTEHEELTQQVFVEAYFNLDSFRAKAPFEHWLARIATRIGYQFWRKKKHSKAVPLPDEQWNSLAGPKDNAIDNQQAAELVHHLLAQLSPPDRLVLTLRYLEQCDIAQTAYRIGWTQVRVRVQSHRAMQKLKVLLANKNIELQL